MGDEPEEKTLKEKLLFYTTAFFILLGTFSLFAFLFLVPFIIDPAFTTIFMQFDETPAICQTVASESRLGAKNCSWSSCREGCTKDLFSCTQIRVNYQPQSNRTKELNISTIIIDEQISQTLNNNDKSITSSREHKKQHNLKRSARAIRDYDYNDEDTYIIKNEHPHFPYIKEKITFDVSRNGENEETDTREHDNDDDNDNDNDNSTWFFTRARLFPNVKGCGYPPALNCTIWFKKYIKIGTNFSCYYSREDPGLVISDLDMWQNTLNLIYAMAIPIPSFIISVIYLAFAYFKIYNDDEEAVPLDKNAESMAEDNDNDNDNDECDDNICVDVVIPNGVTPLSVSGPLTPNSDINSFGHQLKVKMADEMSRESLDAGIISNSGSLQGNLSKTMTTSISTPPGPTAAV